MKIQLAESKYAEVSPRLRERFFLFVKAAELREIQSKPNNLQYLEIGPRDGRPLIFFTGGIKSPVYSFSVIEAFSRICRVIAPVQPQCRTLAEYFKGLDAILNREKIESFSVAGSSWGGQIAQVAALQYADRVDKVVLANTGISAGKVLVFLVRLHRWGAARKAPRQVVEEFRIRALKMLADTDETGAFWKAVFDDLYERNMSGEDYLSLIDTQIDYMENYAPEVRKRGFAGPVLILASKNETSGPANMTGGLMKAYPHAQLHVFEAGAHHPALLHVEEYRQAVEAFMAAEK
jgi:pimeloyl-ACP methyl ester carboxylesterase